MAAMLMILGVGWSPLLGVILLDLFLSPPKGHSITPAGILSHWGLWGWVGWDCGGEGSPQIKLREEATDKGVNA